MLHKPRNYIHIKSIYHIPCTHKRHPITHFHEWVNTVLFIGDSFENTDHVRKKLVIAIMFVSFSFSWKHCYYTTISPAESRDVCFNIHVRHPSIHTYIYMYMSNNGHHSLPSILDLTLMAKQFEYYHTSCFNEVQGVVVTGFTLFVSPSVHLSVSLQQYSPNPLHIYTSYQATSDVSRFYFSKLTRFELLANS